METIQSTTTLAEASQVPVVQTAVTSSTASPTAAQDQQQTNTADNGYESPVQINSNSKFEVLKIQQKKSSLTSNSPNSLIDNYINGSDNEQDVTEQQHPKHLTSKPVQVLNGQPGHLVISPSSSVRSHSPTLRTKAVYFNDAQQGISSNAISSQLNNQNRNNYTNSNNNSLSSTGSIRSNKVIFIDHNIPRDNKQQNDSNSSSSVGASTGNRIINRFEVETSPSDETRRFEVETEPNYKESIVLLNKSKDESSSNSSDEEDKNETEESSENSKKKKSFKIRYNEAERAIEFEIKNDCLSQLSTVGFYQALFAEIFGTFLLVLFIGGFGLPINDKTHQDVPQSLNGCLGSGLVVSSLVWCLAHVSGANLNPAVTIALLFTGESNLVRSILYIAAQLIGATLGAHVLREIVPDHIKYVQNIVNVPVNESLSRAVRQVGKQAVGVNRTIIKVLTTTATTTIATTTTTVETLTSGFTSDINTIQPLQIAVTSLNKDLTEAQGFGIELIATFILMMTVFACLDSKRKDLHGSFPLSIGLAVVVGALFAGPFTGGSLNPARSFGPALVMNNWENHWIYWLGPIMGALLAGVVYKTLVYKSKPKQLRNNRSSVKS